MRWPARLRVSGRHVVIALIVIAAGWQAVAFVVDEFTPSAGGTTSSSYGTGAGGLAAVAELLSRTGHAVRTLRVAPDRTDLDTSTTLVVIDPTVLTPSDLIALRRFVVRGGRLLAGGSASDPDSWLAGIMRDPPPWTDSGPTLWPVTPGSGLASEIGTVRSNGSGSFTGTGSATPVVGTGSQSLVDRARIGAGDVLLLADASPLQNRDLARADNAALAIALAGDGGSRSVTFAESLHGYGTARGLAALPLRWKWLLVGLALAAAVAVAARVRRIGDPEPVIEEPLPPRRAHIEALAVALQRTRQPAAAAAPVRDHARRIVITRAHLAQEPTPEALLAGARELGLDEPQARAVAGLDIPTDDDGVLAIGQALSALEPR